MSLKNPPTLKFLKSRVSEDYLANMAKVRDEYYIVFECTYEYIFTKMWETQEQAEKHVETRLKQIKGTEMEGRTLLWKKYVVLE